MNNQAEDWKVIRTDDNGHTFTVRSGMTQDAARQLHETLTRRGHKQFYEIQRSRPHPPTAPGVTPSLT